MGLEVPNRRRKVGSINKVGVFLKNMHMFGLTNGIAGQYEGFARSAPKPN